MADAAARLDLKNKTRNLRHRSMIATMCQYHKELLGAGTSDQSMVDKADFQRLKDYLDDCDVMIDGLNVAGAALADGAAGGRPEVDTPLTRDDWWDLASPPEVPPMENIHWEEMCHRVSKAIREMKDSQSALFANNWHPSDPPRWKKYLQAIRYDMENVIGKIEPMDQPTTTPRTNPVYQTVGDAIDTSGATNADGASTAN